MPDPYAKNPGLATQDKKATSGIGGGARSVAQDLMQYDARTWRSGGGSSPGGGGGSIGASSNAWLAAQRYAEEKRRRAEIQRAKEAAARARAAAIKRMEASRRRLLMAPGEEYDKVLSPGELAEKESYRDLLEERRSSLRSAEAGKKRLQGQATEVEKSLGGQSYNQWITKRDKTLRAAEEAKNAQQAKKAGVKRFEGIANHELPIALNRSIEALSPGEREYIEAVRQFLDGSPALTGSAPRGGRGGDDITSDAYWADLALPGGPGGEPELGETPGVILIRDPKTGEATTETLTNAYRSIIDKVNDATVTSTAHAGDLAWSMMHAGYYSDAAKKRLKDRMAIYKDANGRERFRLIWGADDEDALKNALEDAAGIGASDVGEGLRTNSLKIRDFEQIVTQKAVLNRQMEMGVLMQGGGEARDPASLAPGKYGDTDLDQEQIGNVQTIIDVGTKMGASQRDIGIAIVAAMQESRLKNVNYGDRDSLGLFQQRPSQGWGSPAQVRDPNYAAQKFFDALLKIENRDSLSMGEAAQKVQRSAHPDRYDNHIDVAADLIGAKNLGTGADLDMLGAVKPHVRSAAKEFSAIFGVDNIGGIGERSNPSDHPDGKAIDVMVKGPKGNTIADYAVRNAKRLGITYIIWNRQIWDSRNKRGWEAYAPGFSGASPHTDHVHVSFHDRAGGGDQGLMQEIAGGTSLYGGPGDSGGTGGSGGSGGGQGGSFGAGGVSYSDPDEIGEAANSIAQQEIGRDLDEDEIAEMVNLYHGREADYQQAAGAGLSATSPDITGAVRAFIKKKLEEEQGMMKEGQLAMAAFQLLSGRGDLGIG